MTTRPSHTFLRISSLSGALFFYSSTVVVAATPDAIHRGPPLVGVARVIDGDTIDISGQRVRLEGIDAPELGQTCETALGQNWPCGRASVMALKRLIGQKQMSCEQRGQDKYRRVLAVCFVDGRNINEAMVRDGFAWAFVKYSNEFASAELTARAAKSGVWQGRAVAPWDYRSHEWQVAETAAPSGCAIKGNISGSGHIYHVPWGPWYDKVRIDPGQGERWFCSETEAMEAGWRPVASQ
jgi:endonuclease YncB( thermonuclease family)